MMDRLKEINKSISTAEKIIEMLTLEVVEIVKKEIWKKFPDAKIDVEHTCYECDEYWVRVDVDNELFDSDDFLGWISHIDLDILFHAGVYSIYIVGRR